MIKQREGVVRQAHHPGNIFSGNLKGDRAQDDRSLAALFEGDAVMQTARRTTTSVAGRCDQEITLRN